MGRQRTLQSGRGVSTFLGLERGQFVVFGSFFLFFFLLSRSWSFLWRNQYFTFKRGDKARSESSFEFQLIAGPLASKHSPVCRRFNWSGIFDWSIKHDKSDQKFRILASDRVFLSQLTVGMGLGMWMEYMEWWISLSRGGRLVSAYI